MAFSCDQPLLDIVLNFRQPTETHDQRNLCRSGGKELSMIVHKSFGTDVERQFNLACDQSGQYAQKHIKAQRRMIGSMLRASIGELLRS
jgi:hypothetical protein